MGFWRSLDAVYVPIAARYPIFSGCLIALMFCIRTCYELYLATLVLLPSCLFYTVATFDANKNVSDVWNGLNVILTIKVIGALRTLPVCWADETSHQKCLPFDLLQRLPWMWGCFP